MFKSIALGLALAFSVLVGAPGMSTVSAQADPTDAAQTQVCNGISTTVGGGCSAAQGAKLNTIIAGVLNILSIVAGVAAVIMIVISGLKSITSSGDSSNIAGAKNTLIYAIVGLIVVALSQTIVRFVLARV
ncbi:MAG TPA: pilin [Candidatus Limnocylindrales bacterium]|nr:pilin [Candidatus Limnocylindrales bacterium]